MEKMSHHTVRVRDVSLDRYYPPTTDKITTANRDIGHFADTGNEKGLHKIGVVIGRAAMMVSDQSDVECYRGLSIRLNGVLEELGEQPVHFTA